VVAGQSGEDNDHDHIEADKPTETIDESSCISKFIFKLPEQDKIMTNKNSTSETIYFIGNGENSICDAYDNNKPSYPTSCTHLILCNMKFKDAAHINEYLTPFTEITSLTLTDIYFVDKNTEIQIVIPPKVTTLRVNHSRYNTIKFNNTDNITAYYSKDRGEHTLDNIFNFIKCLYISNYIDSNSSIIKQTDINRCFENAEIIFYLKNGGDPFDTSITTNTNKKIYETDPIKIDFEAMKKLPTLPSP